MMKPILITGCSRSGASMIAKAIITCGVSAGVVSNMFENLEIKKMEEDFLNQFGVDKAGQYPLPNMEEMLIPNDWQTRVERSELLWPFLSTSYKWMYKSSLSSLIWPVWNYAYPNARWIIVRRDIDDIVQSCMKTKYMTALKDKTNQKAVGATTEEQGWLWWVRQYENNFTNMINAGLNCKVIWPDRMVHGNYEQLYDTLDWLGLSWKSEVFNKILNMIDPLLWHSRIKEKRIWQQE